MAVKTTIIAPDLWLPYAQEALVAKANILATVVEIDNNPPVSDSGYFFSAPYQAPLSDVITSLTEVVADSTEVTPYAPSDYSIITPVKAYGFGLNEAQYSNLVRGENNIQQLGTQVGETMSLLLQDKLINVITAQFESGGALTDTTSGDYNHIYQPGTTLSGDVLFEAQGLFGENMAELNTMVVHQKVLTSFLSKYAMEKFPLSDITNSIISNGLVYRWQGINFIVNNTLCAVNTDGTYPCYLFAGKPFYMGIATPMYELVQDKANTGMGTTEHYYYTRVAPAVKGISYTSATIPATDTTLGTAASYTLKWNTKNVKIVKIDVSVAV